MKNNENNRSLLRRYLDGLYTTDDARRLLNELQAPEYNTDMLQELTDEVWEEAFLQSPQTDLEREQYKKEARLLLKRIEHKKRMWFRRVSLAVASAAAVVCLILGSVSYIRYIDRQQTTYLEASTSYGERKRDTASRRYAIDFELLFSRVAIRTVLQTRNVEWNWRVRGIFVYITMRNNLS